MRFHRCSGGRPILHWATPYRFFPLQNPYSLTKKLRFKFRSAQARPQSEEARIDMRTPKKRTKKSPGNPGLFVCCGLA
jgi:hypothetical protein